MSTPLYDLPFFRSLFAAIPDDQWCNWTVLSDDGRRCARGHAGDISNMGRNRERLAAFDGHFESLIGHVTLMPGVRNDFDEVVSVSLHRCDIVAAQISNGTTAQYQQATPKARILAAIDDLIAGTIPS